ncbi:hypothetical protein [Halostagnicola sp. A56]|uniref:hypothetical protein n=1 Tax=Halostagnicola sp. A56 TaxID=1495067 RepID=UPI001E607EB8|nr:hypothetical protein [Halostagnicola sp. A56]
MDFLTESIHKKYSLIRCLNKGIAYHHGMVPKIAREEIEQIYDNSASLDTIVTTPTLMQGVNLSAEKIFLVSANRGSDELTDFEFNNLIGRVGRHVSRGSLVDSENSPRYRVQEIRYPHKNTIS